MIAKSEVLEPVEVARSLAESGVSVVPLEVDGSKLPKGKWKEWQRRIVKTHEITALFRGSVGIATVCGEVSGNLECLDIDNPALVEAFEALVEMTDPGLLAKLPTVATPRDNWGGRHYRYRLPYKPGGNEKLAESAPEPEFDKQGNPVIDQRTGRQKIAPKTWIETRGEGGYAIAPGSPPETHESGLSYKHIAGPPLTDIPLITAEQHAILWRAARSFNRNIPEQSQGNLASVHEGPGISPGDDFDAKASIAELIEPVGWVKVHGSGGITHWRRPGKEGKGWSATTGCTSKDGKPLFCVFSSNAHPFDGAMNGRPCSSYSPFAVYTLLHHGGDFRAAAKALYAKGYGTRIDRTTVQGQQQANQRNSIIDSHPPIRRAPTIGQLVSVHPTLRKPFITGLLRRGETMNVVAPPKTGKSWLVYLLCLKAVGGGRLFDTYRTEPGRILILDNELHEETTANRIPTVAKALGVSWESVGGLLHVENMRGQGWHLYNIHHYLDQYQPGEFNAIVFDALYRFIPPGKDENSNSDMAEMYNILDGLANRLDCSIINIHHTTKGNQSQKAVTDVGAGGGSQSRAADTHLVLRQHQENNVVVLDAAVRSWEPIDPVCLRWRWPLWELAPDLNPANLRTDRPKRPTEADKDQQKLSKFEQQVERCLDLLCANGPMSKTNWRKKAGIGGGVINEIVTVLMEEGRIEPTPIKAGSVLIDGYKPAQSGVGQNEESELSACPG